MHRKVAVWWRSASQVQFAPNSPYFFISYLYNFKKFIQKTVGTFDLITFLSSLHVPFARRTQTSAEAILPAWRTDCLPLHTRHRWQIGLFGMAYPYRGLQQACNRLATGLIIDSDRQRRGVRQECIKFCSISLRFGIFFYKRIEAASIFWAYIIRFPISIQPSSFQASLGHTIAVRLEPGRLRQVLGRPARFKFKL